MYNKVFDITPEQKKLVNKMKAAYNACKKAGLMPVNYYGELYFFQLKYVNGYGNRDSGFDPELTVPAHYNASSISITQEWTDDSHLMQLTTLGMKEFKKED